MYPYARLTFELLSTVCELFIADIVETNAWFFLKKVSRYVNSSSDLISPFADIHIWRGKRDSNPRPTV